VLLSAGSANDLMDERPRRGQDMLKVDWMGGVREDEAWEEMERSMLESSRVPTVPKAKGDGRD
jgi:hypothetical protein